MESLIDAIGGFLAGLWALTQSGFDGVNQVVGLIIALVAALMMPAWRSLWATAAGATVVHLIVQVLRPVLDGGQFALPPVLTLTFWMTALALFLGYAVVIAVFFMIKSLIPGLGGRRAHAH